jgi:serine/threonine protein kinase
MHTSFNKYHLSTQLSRKSLRDVYLAYPVDEPEHKVVLKVFDATCVPSNYDYADFAERANLLKQLNHQHIVPVLDIGVEEGEPYVVSEYLPYGSLRSRMDSTSSERLTSTDAFNICIQLGQALGYIHQFHIVHGNVKPENILFDADGKVLLADLSLVGLIDINKLGYKSEAHGVSYMAPEQFISTVNEKSDQYALACIIYELITGRVPFTAHGFSLMWLKHSTDVPVAPSKIVPDLPQSVEVALLKALANDPAERYDDIAAFIEPFQSILLPQPAQAVQTSAFPLANTASSPDTGELSESASNESSTESRSSMPLLNELSMTASITDEEPEDAFTNASMEEEDEKQDIAAVMEEHEEDEEYVVDSKEEQYMLDAMEEKADDEDGYVLESMEDENKGEDPYMVRSMESEEYMTRSMKDENESEDPYMASSTEDEDEDPYMANSIGDEDEDPYMARSIRNEQEGENPYMARSIRDEQPEDPDIVESMEEEEEDEDVAEVAEEENEHAIENTEDDGYTAEYEDDDKYILDGEEDDGEDITENDEDIAEDDDEGIAEDDDEDMTEEDNDEDVEEGEDEYMVEETEEGHKYDYVASPIEEEEENQYIDEDEDETSVESDDFTSPSESLSPFEPGSRLTRRIAPSFDEYEDQDVEGSIEDEDTEDQYADAIENNASIESDDFALSSRTTFPFRPRSHSFRRATSFDEAEDEYEDNSSLEFGDDYDDNSSLEFGDDYDDSLIGNEDDFDSPSGTPFPFGSGNFSRQGTGAFKPRSRQRLNQQSGQLDDDDDNVGASVGIAEPPTPQKQTQLRGDKRLEPDLDEPPLTPPPTPAPSPRPRPARSKKGPTLLLIVVLIFSLGIVYTHFATGGSPTQHPTPTSKPSQAMAATPTPSESATSTSVIQPTDTSQSSPTAVATSSTTPPPPEGTPSAVATAAVSSTPVPTTPVSMPTPPPPPPPPPPKPTPTPTPVPRTNLVCPYQEFNQYTNLTREGTLDWEQWGLKKATDVNHKAGVKPQISNVTLLGHHGRITSDHTSPISFTWSDGTPTKSVNRSTGAIYVTGPPNTGFSITVPASTTPRTLRLYVGANLARGLFFASLGGITCKDASLDMTHDPTKTVDNAVYTITYSTNLPNQKLTIDYTEMESNGGYVLLEAAALH